MTRSLGLWLYLLLARRGSPAPQPPALPAPDRPGATDADLVWFHVDAGGTLPSLAHLARQMARARPGLAFLVTAPDVAPALDGFPAGSIGLPQPPDHLPDLQRFFDRYRPSIVCVTGLSLPPALIHLAGRRGLPLVLADLHLAPAARRPWRWRRRMFGALLGRFDTILARDSDSVRLVRALLRREIAVEVTGRIEETTAPLKHSEAERAELAELMQARPVWLAAACPPAEERAVIDAHARALRHAHRILLILAPSEPSRAPALIERLTAEGMTFGQRSREDEPEEDMQVFLADTEGEMGLWYRLAPVSFMGGTLREGGTGRNPIEPAALGSAILHGPFPGPYPEAYARLAEAQATRRVMDEDGLALAVTELIAPDKAAVLAHNAWAASSGGAEVTERVMQALFQRMDAARAARAGAAA